MTSPKPKPSGPLWAWADSSGALQIGSLSPVEGSMTRFPVRVIPGHGKVVPVELVEAIDLAFDGSNAHSDQWITNVRAAIKAALGGAM